MRFDLTHPDLAHVMRWVQHGVVARRQIEELGGKESDIRRMVRRRELTAVHPGVYVDHTGPSPGASGSGSGCSAPGPRR